jgi:hypothetical protein
VFRSDHGFPSCIVYILRFTPTLFYFQALFYQLNTLDCVCARLIHKAVMGMVTVLFSGTTWVVFRCRMRAVAGILEPGRLAIAARHWKRKDSFRLRKCITVRVYVPEVYFSVTFQRRLCEQSEDGRVVVVRADARYREIYR